MAQNFNITARIQLQGPNNIRAVVRSIQSQLNTIRADVTVNIASGTSTRINALNTNLQRVNASLLSIRTASDAANVSLLNLASTLRTVRNLSTRININVNARQATQQINDFGGQAALAVRRFAAFAVPTTVFLGLVAAIKEGVAAAIDFEKEMIRLSQVTGKSVAALGDLSGEITRLATSLGTSSKDLSIVATTIAQAGLNARDTKIALEALARSSLAATFTDIQETTEGAIAVFRQFDIQAKDLQGVIGSLNSVSAQFAVESDDLVSVIRRTGGAFKASGGNLNELLGLFTSVRATTRESADSIATGFRTIFTRIQRPRTIEFLKELGVSLQDAKGQFIGPLESIRRLNAALSEIPSTDPRFAAVIEELGGFRQVSKVIPLIQQFPEALKAISVAEQGQQSIVEDSITAQKSLANQIVKVKEEFLALFREITADKSLQLFVREILALARGLIEVTRAVKPLIPLIGAIALVKGVQGTASLGSSFLSGLAGGGRRRFASGGKVPGSGNSDSVPAMLTPGEFVIRKSAAKAIGFDKLAKMNKFKKGGKVQGGVIGGIDEEFAIAALYPSGVTKTEEFPYKFYPSGSKKGLTKNIRLQVSSLTSPTSEKLQGVFKNKIFGAVSQSADVLQRSLGMERVQPANLLPILKKSGLDNIVGNLFEGTLAVAGAPYSDKVSNLSAIDFPGGLGENLAKAFGIKPNVKTEAKAKASSSEFIKPGRNLDNFLRNKYAAVVEQVVGPAGGELKQGGGRDAAAAVLSGLSASDKEKVKGIINSSKRGRWSSAQMALAPFGLRYLKESDAKGANAIKFAKGGKAPGAGNEDKVPALLTPGEFVINKKAAQRIGLSNLNRLNKADKVQKFASGGSVPRGGIFSRAEGVGFALAGVTSLASSFIKLEGETQKVISQFSGIATVAAGLSLSIRSLADQGRLNRLKGSGFLLGGTNRNFLDTSTKFLAKNFDTLVLSVSAAAGAAVIFGQSMQDAALSSAKTAASRQELDKAINKDKFGSTLVGAGTGAGIGAALGSVIPGIGTAVGAAVGAGIGGLVGYMSANTKELIKAFTQAGFDRIDEKISDAFDDFSSKRANLGTSALNIGQLARQQLANVRGASDSEQRRELTKQLRNNLVNYRNLSSAIAENVTSFEEFTTVYGGAGRDLVESIAFLTNKSFPEIRKQIENEIEARKIQIEGARQQALANSQIKVFTVNIKTFADALSNVTDKIGETQNSLDQLISTIEGGSSAGRFNSISGDLFSRAAAGGIQNVGRVSSAARQLTASLDRNSVNTIAENAISVTRLTNALPGILESVSQGVGLGGDTERADELFGEAIDRLTGVSDQMKSVTKSIFGSELASRESSGDAGFRKVAREDLLGLADKLVPEAIKAAVQELDKVNSTIQNIISTIGDRLSKQSQIELSVAKQRAEIEDRIFEVAKLRLKAGQEVSLGSVRANDARRRSILLGGGPALGAVGAGNRILGLVRARENAQNQINASGAGTVAQQKALSDFAKFDSEIQRLTTYMKDLGSSTAELTLLQDKLSKAEADRQSGKNLLDKLLFGEGKDRVKFAGAVQNIGKINAGNKNLIDLPKEQRDAVLELLRDAPQNRASGLLGGKKPEDFLNEQIRKSFNLRAVREGANVNAADALAKELTTRTKEEDVIRAELIKVQQASVDAELELAKVNIILSQQFAAFNTKLLSDFPALIKNALLEASVATLGQQSQFLSGQRGDALRKINGVNDLATQIGVAPRDLRDVGRMIQANQGNFSNLNQALNTRQANSSFNNQNFVNAAVAQAKQVVGQSFRFDVGFGTGTANASDVADIVSRSEQVLNNEDFKSRLQKRLEAVVFKDASGSIAGATAPGQARRVGLEGDVFDVNRGDDAAQRKTLKQIINNEITKFKDENIAKASKQVVEAQNALKGNLGPVLGNNFNAVVGRLANPEQLNEFIAEFSQVNEPLDRLTQQFSNLDAQLQKVNRNISVLNGQRVPIAANPAIGRAGGGIVNGHRINSPITTFTPRGTDKIPAILSKGEFVVNAQAAKANIGALQAMNLARGGKVKMTAEQYKAQQAQKRAAYFATAAGQGRKKILDQRAADSQKKFEENILNFDNMRTVQGEANYKKALQAKRVDPKKNAILPSNYAPNKEVVGLRGDAARDFFLRENFKRNPNIKGELYDDIRAEAKLKSQGAGIIGAGIQGLFGLAKQANESLQSQRYAVGLAEDAADDDLNPYFLKYMTDTEKRIASIHFREKTIGNPYVSPFRKYKNRLLDDGPAPVERNKTIFGFAAGGPVPGSGNRDSVPAMLTPGEFVLNRRAAKSLGLNSLANFNQRFANGGVVSGSGGGAGGMLNIDPAALATLEKFYSTFSDVVSQFGSSISRFAEVGTALSSALSNWGSTANRLAEALSSFPTEVQVTHSAIPVVVSVSGLEGLETAIADKVLSTVSDRMAVGKAKANDGKSPFFSNR